MPLNVIAVGSVRRVLVWAQTKKMADTLLSDCPGITDEESKKVLRGAGYVANAMVLTNKAKFKKVEGQESLFAIKSYQLRLLGTFMQCGDFVIVYCCRKKKNRYRMEDILKAQENKGRMLKEEL